MWPVLIWLNKAIDLAIDVVAYAKKQTKEEVKAVAIDEILKKQKEQEQKEWNIVNKKA